MDKKFIDVEILIDELSASCMPIFEKGISGILGDEQSIADVIREQPAADVQEVRHWTSVEDRLPNPEERVLVFVKALGKIDNIHKDVITTNWITSSGNWIDNWKGIGNYIITHWMPLPDPPSTTDDGDTNT